MIGERIKQRRVEIGISAEELADRIGKSRATVYRYENGDIEDMPITIIEPLAKALNTTPAYLMNWEQCKAQGKLKKIVELLDGKGSILVRDANPDKWFVHCHWDWSSEVQSEVPYEERIKKIIFKEYVLDLDKALDEIIEKLEGFYCEKEN